MIKLNLTFNETVEVSPGSAGGAIEVMTLNTETEAPVLILQTGLSAYQIAVKNGYIGTEAQWLVSLAAFSGYTHAQSSPATTWNINHNLNRYPSIELLTIGLVKFEADISHISLNQAIVTIATPMAGIAQCN